METLPTQKWVLSIREACTLANMSKGRFYGCITPGSPYFDASFPKPFPLGNHPKSRRRGILARDLSAWIEGQAKLSHSPAEAAASSSAIPRTGRRKPDGATAGGPS